MADDTLTERVAALERAVTDGHADDGLPDTARMATRLDDAESAVAELDDRVAELEATVQALRGFAGGVRAVDEAVERRANDAVARVERLETELRDVEERIERDTGRTPEFDADGPAPVDDGESRQDTPTGADSGRQSRTATDTGRPEARRRDVTTTSAGAHDDPDGLGETVEARSDAALAEMAAETEEPEPVEDSESASLGERLRRLL
ncbi:DUF7310 family coiled-coil domain-containing protein [Haloplanus sp. C73]|uniref:DUF7310 family coiled-coil domain-containing protein n=1 Tax=Haloplanus sp. C73 TaxID=3421641 RepID=UPI003EBA3D6B